MNRDFLSLCVWKPLLLPSGSAALQKQGGEKKEIADLILKIVQDVLGHCRFSSVAIFQPVSLAARRSSTVPVSLEV